MDAFYIKLVTARPSHNNVVKMLTELRVLLLNRYGAKGVDFDALHPLKKSFCRDPGQGNIMRSWATR